VAGNESGDGPVHVTSATADQMFLDITPSQATGLPRYTGEMELTNHSAGSLTSQAYQKALAAQRGAARRCRGRMPRLPRNGWSASVSARAAERCVDAGDGRDTFMTSLRGTATPKSYEFAWNDDVIAMNQFAGSSGNATEGVAAALNTGNQRRPGGSLQSAEHRAGGFGGSKR